MPSQVKRPSTALTPHFVKRINRPGKYGDGGRGSHGLQLVVTKTGTKHWKQQLWYFGKTHFIGLGSVEFVTLPEARAKALANHKMAKEGKDPLFERGREDQPTLAEMAEEVIEAKLSTWRNPRRQAQAFRRHILTYCRRIANQPIGTIKAHHVLECLKPIWTTKGRAAQQCKNDLSLVFDRAMTLDWRNDNPVDRIASLLPKAHKTTHHASLSNGQVAEAIAKVRACAASDSAKLAFEFCVLTAARQGEVRGATWAEIDMEAKVWSVPGAKMKMDRPHRVPLSTRALAILAEARKLHNGDVVFPSPTGKPMNEKTIYSRLFATAGVTGTTLHGFRASFADWAVENGHEKPLVDTALAHKPKGMTDQAYFRADLLDQRRPMMQAWAEYLTR